MVITKKPHLNSGRRGCYRQSEYQSLQEKVESPVDFSLLSQVAVQPQASTEPKKRGRKRKNPIVIIPDNIPETISETVPERRSKRLKTNFVILNKFKLKASNYNA